MNGCIHTHAAKNSLVPGRLYAGSGFADYMESQHFGKAVLDELHKRFGWIPLYDHLNHSVEDQKPSIDFD